MIPQTAATLVGFLLLVVPGLIFEFLRLSRRPSFDRSAFEEFSTFALASVAFTSLALATLFGIRDHLPFEIPALRPWIESPSDYWAEHPRLIPRFVAAVVLLASLYAAIWHAILNHLDRASRAEREPGRAVAKVMATANRILGSDPRWKSSRTNVWRKLLADDVPVGRRTAISVQLQDGRILSGQLAGYTNTGSGDERDIALHTPVTILYKDHPLPTTLERGTYDHIIIPGREIVWLAVRFDAAN